MAVFQVLPEMVGAEEFLRLVAFAEFVDVGEMGDPFLPVRVRLVGEFLSAIAADVDGGELVGGGGELAVGVVGIWRDGCGRVEGALVGVREGGA